MGAIMRWAAALMIVASAAHAAETGVKAAVFPFDLIDSSLQGEIEGVSEAELERLVMIADILRDKMGAAGAWEIVDTAPEAEAIAAVNLQGCNGCDARIARDLGADLAVTGTVQKVSNLILNINVYVRDAETKKPVFSASVDIRGNTDESWSHGIRWMIRNRLLKAYAP